MIFSCQISSQNRRSLGKRDNIVTKARPEKRPNIHESQCHRPKKEGVLLHNACLDVFLVPPEKRSWGNYFYCQEKENSLQSPILFPFLHISMCCMCAYMVPCFQSYSENESRTTATVVLPSCFSIGYKFCCEKHLSLSISILCVLEEHQVPEAKMINGSICMFLLSFC